MNDYAFARILHVLGVVLWIGGVAMVTTAVIPALAKMKSSAAERLDFFGHIEARFAPQARLTTLLVGLSGFYMVYLLDAWSRFTELRFWWMHAMVLVWLVFTLMLFVIAPRMRKRRMRTGVEGNPEQRFARMHRMHWFLLSLSLITIAGAVAGSHGWMLPGE
jgi:uncharacterized membrane protein